MRAQIAKLEGALEKVREKPSTSVPLSRSPSKSASNPRMPVPSRGPGSSSLTGGGGGGALSGEDMLTVRSFDALEASYAQELSQRGEGAAHARWGLFQLSLWLLSGA